MKDKISYEEYAEQLMATLRASTSKKLTVNMIHKNNGVELSGIVLVEGNFAPVAYIEETYEDFKKGKSIELILDELLGAIEEDDDEHDIINFANYEEVSNTIYPALVNYDMNKEYLQKVVHRRFLDLAVIYKIWFHVIDGKSILMPIFNCDTEYWGKTEEDIYNKAMENLRRENEFKMMSVVDFCLEKLSKNVFPNKDRREIDEAFSSFLGKRIIAVSSTGFSEDGASVLLFGNVFKEIIKKHCPERRKLLIMPMDIKLVIAVPYPEKTDEVKGMLELHERSIKTTPSDLVLSRNLYCYDEETDALSVIEIKEEEE